MHVAVQTQSRSFKLRTANRNAWKVCDIGCSHSVRRPVGADSFCSCLFGLFTKIKPKKWSLLIETFTLNESGDKYVNKTNAAAL